MDTQPLFKLLLRSTGASIDSRTIRPGQLFFGLSGSQTDGSRFAGQALDTGAMAVVLRGEPPADPQDERYYYVDDVLETMQTLARDYRRYLNCEVMAITGSNGKTTNKNLLHMVLSTRLRVHSTAGNFNNHIGLPLTILNAPQDTQFLLLEMGTNHFGEIRDLCRIAEPDYGSILNVGKSHLEFLLSVEGVLRAKSELADALYGRDGWLFLNEEEPSLSPLQKHPVKKISFDRNALPGNDFKVTVRKSTPSIELEITSATASESYLVHSALWGDHNVLNLIHAIAVGSYFQASMDQMVEALTGYTPVNNRSQIINWRGHQVYLDAYNANPTSMAHAIRSFRAGHPDTGVLILGEMGELGAVAAEEHLSILELLTELGFDDVYLVGDEFQRAGEGRFPGFRYVTDVVELKNEVWPEGIPMLIKGSRFMALERLVEE